MITAADFVRRFEALVLGGVGPGLPRRAEDRHVLLKAVSLGLGGESPYSERSLGLALRDWLAMAGPRVDVDSVSLRRALVDFGYLRRDPAGQTYERDNGYAVTFAPEVDALVPRDVVANAFHRVQSKAESRRPPS